MEELEFLDTPIHMIHTHNYTRACGDHARTQDYNDGIHLKCMIKFNFSFTYVNFVQKTKLEMALT